MKNSPIFSVIMPAYNCERFISEAIESVLNQSFQEFELIIVDDASTDRTAERVEAFNDDRIHFIRNEKNIGVSETRNRAIALSKGLYIAFLDSDDAWLENKLYIQYKILKDTGFDLCFTSYEFMDEYSNPIKKPYIVPSYTDFNSLLCENVIGLSTSVIKAELAKLHSFSSSYAHEDFVYWLTLLKNGSKAVGIYEVCVKYRLLNQSRSGNKLLAAKNRWLIMRNHLALSFPQSAYYLFIYFLRAVKKYG